MQGFTYHAKCQCLNITHLIFAYDLLMMCGADVQSFQLIKEVLSDFHSFTGSNQIGRRVLSFLLGLIVLLKVFLRDTFSYSYSYWYSSSPVPTLDFYKAEIQCDCVVLKKKILGRIQSWSNRSLSFGGRAQLVLSVLFSIQVYWSSISVSMVWP